MESVGMEYGMGRDGIRNGSRLNMEWVVTNDRQNQNMRLWLELFFLFSRR